MKCALLGFRVRAFVPGEGWREDRFALKQVAIECARLCGEGATVDQIKQEVFEAGCGMPEYREPEEFEQVWPEE